MVGMPSKAHAFQVPNRFYAPQVGFCGATAQALAAHETRHGQSHHCANEVRDPFASAAAAKARGIVLPLGPLNVDIFLVIGAPLVKDSNQSRGNDWRSGRGPGFQQKSAAALGQTPIYGCIVWVCACGMSWLAKKNMAKIYEANISQPIAFKSANSAPEAERTMIAKPFA